MMKDGVLEGETVLYTSGRLRARLQFRNGKQNGEAVFFDDAGDIMTKSLYENGKLTGDSFYYGEGKLVRKSAYKSGELNGYTVDYYPNGKPREVSTYKDNLLDGDLVRLDEAGKITERLHYSKGKLQPAPAAGLKLPGKKT
jgi:antitoxin component YwqK of YwqJK toxin-antitoxin module